MYVIVSNLWRKSNRKSDDDNNDQSGPLSRQPAIRSDVSQKLKVVSTTKQTNKKPTKRISFTICTCTGRYNMYNKRSDFCVS